MVTLPVTTPSLPAVGLFYDPLAPYREGPRVRRLAVGGKRIRTFGPARPLALE